MTELSLREEYEEISDHFWKLIDWQGEAGSLYQEHYEKTYAPGVLDTKTKRLMAMGAAIVMGCRGCMLGQTQKAIAAGATRDEIMETCSVMLSLGGTMAGSKISVVMALLKEMGMMEDVADPEV